MRSSWFSRAARAACAVTLLAATAVTTVAAKPGPERPGRRRAANLFAVTNAVLNVNRVFCGINNLGELCVDPTNSPVLGGGFWPKGTQDQYIFNSGLQLAGVIPNDAGGGEAIFPWAGDTVGAFFFDARGTQVQGDAVTLVYNSLDAADVADWPAAAYVNDTTLFHPVLTSRADSGALRQDGSGAAISQQDLWTRAWDGNPAFLSGRTHPMGILVEERGVAWNFPTGNEDIIYFLFTFYNITAGDCTVYDNLFPHVQDAVRREALQQEICAVGQDFQARNEAVFSSVQIPDAGYAIGSLFAAFSMDPDVGDAGSNFSTAILPFNMGLAYKSDFLEAGWNEGGFPQEIFGAPFVAAPGFVGVKYLKSPEVGGAEVGLTMFSNTRNAATGFPDPIGVVQLYRYLSGTVSPAAGDNPCTAGVDPQTRNMCFLDQTAADTRFFQASGPFTLSPGEAQTIVVAYVHAAPLPAGWVVGTDNLPGIPASRAEIFADPTGSLRFIERAAGWVDQGDSNNNSSIEQNEVITVPRSLLNKALVAQAVFDNRFLLPFAPEAPSFFLVPGDNQVTITWQPSETETVKPGGGDPFFAIASQPTVLDSLGNPTPNPLYDPNFRQYDVEGYRIYRGRTTSQLELVAQFDYAGRQIIDFTGNFAYVIDVDEDGKSECAPELGITDDCPAAFGTTPPFADSVLHDLTGDIIQIPVGGRVALADSSILILRADTAVTGGGSGFPALEETDVPFAFVDRGVNNSFTYHYAVTAFDVNSFKSGPSSLESPRVTKSTSPRKPSPAEQVAVLVSGLFGDDNVELDPNAAFTIDGATGRFTAPAPPTNALVGAFAPLVPQLLPQLSLVARIDSLTVRTDGDGGCAVSNGLGACYLIYVTFTKDGVPQQFTISEPWPVWTAFDGVTNIVTSLGAVPIAADSASVERFGIPQGFSQFNATVTAVLREYIRFSSFEGQAARRGLIAGSANAMFSPGGSRWFTGTVTETTPHPGAGIRVGHLDGVDTVWTPIHHTDIDPLTAGVQRYGAAEESAMQCLGYGFAGLMRHADVEFTWGAAGQLQNVRDVTHHVDVDFKPTFQSSYGFVGDFNGNGFIDYRDFNYVDIASQFFDDATGPLAFCQHTDPGPGGRQALLSQPVTLPVSLQDIPTAGSGTGFGLYVNGERYIFRLTGGTPPAAGTVWTLRTYAGTVRSSTATLGSVAPSGYTYTPTDRPPIIPGVEVRFLVNQPTRLQPVTSAMLDGIHTVPDPYYVTNALEISPNTKILKFVNMPNQAILRIYSVSGVLVQVLTHNDPTHGGEVTWNLRNRNNQFVASGVYFYHVETADGQSKVGRFTVVNFAQ